MRNLTLLTDLYQLTMLNGYFEKNIHEDMVIFDMFFRKNACNGGYTIVCGIEQFVEYINNIHFSKDDLDKRKMHIKLTELGVQTVRNNIATMEKVLLALGNVIGEETLEQIFKVFEKISDNKSNDMLCD